MSIGGISVIAWLISDKCKSRSNDRDSFVYAMQWCDSQNRKKPATFLLHPAVIREHQECEWKASIGKFRSDPQWMRSHAKYCRWKKYITAESISMRPTWNVISEALSCLFAILFIPMMHSNRQMKWLTHYGSPWIGYPTVEHGAAAVARAVASISIALRATTKAGAYPIKQNNKQTKGQTG